jgi:hypothetical protein
LIVITRYRVVDMCRSETLVAFISFLLSNVSFSPWATPLVLFSAQTPCSPCNRTKETLITGYHINSSRYTSALHPFLLLTLSRDILSNSFCLLPRGMRISSDFPSILNQMVRQKEICNAFLYLIRMPTICAY